MNNDDSTLDDEDGGIIMNDITIEYDCFNVPITVVHLGMVERHAVFGFYRQISGPFKQVKKNLVIICVLCAKSMDGTNYD